MVTTWESARQVNTRDFHEEQNGHAHNGVADRARRIFTTLYWHGRWMRFVRLRSPSAGG